MIAIPRVAPGRGLLAAVGQIGATMRAEIAMQWRRRGLWIAFACVVGLLLLLTVQAGIFLLHLPPTSMYVQQHYTLAELINLMTLNTTTYGAMFSGFVVALLMVDRVERDQQLGMTELQRAAPMGSARYVLGKVLGNYVAVLVPALLGYLLCGLVTLALGWPIALLEEFLQAFVLVFIPGSLAAVGLTFLLASFLPVRVVQIGFSLLWLEVCIGPGWHGLVYTVFNPSGLYVYPVFFPVPAMQYTDPNFQTSLPLALLNIAVLLLTAIVTLTLTCGSLVWQRRREEVA